jgi:hypothetical protein
MVAGCPQLSPSFGSKVLASPTTKAPDLTEAFSIEFLPPELLARYAGVDQDTLYKMEQWAFRSDLEIRKIRDNTMEIAVAMDSISLGTVSLTFDASDATDVKIESEVSLDPACPYWYTNYQEELEEVSENAHWIRLWYESGQTLADGTIFEVRYPDQPFFKFHWADFTDYDVKTEKFWRGSLPDNLLDLMGTGGSLFCWVKNEWPMPGAPYSAAPGWLACDDGAMEIADFIHVDVGAQIPVLTLIHVKGANSDSAVRSVSISSYRGITGQAVKNARFLDRLHLDVGLRAGLEKQIGELVWFDGQASTREAMLDAIAEIGTSYRRMVVLLQPQVTKSRLDQIRNPPTQGRADSDTRSVRQLDTLLLSAQASCRSIGAELWVVADGA